MTSKPVSLQLATYRTMGHGSPARTRRLVKDAPTRSVMSVSTMLRGRGGGTEAFWYLYEVFGSVSECRLLVRLSTNAEAKD